MLAMSKDVKTTRASNAVAAGQTAVTGTVDMAGFSAAQLEVLFGSITTGAVVAVKFGAGDASNGSDATDIDGATISAADTRDNDIAIVDLVDGMPAGKRYLTWTITRTTQDVVIDGVVLHQYNAKALPVTHDSATVVGATLVTG